MSILNTFYILFKSNADDVLKGNEKIKKSTKETERSLRDSNEEADKLGRSFLKMVDGAAAAAGAFAGFKILENGIKTVTEYNAAIANTAKLYGQSAQALKTFAQASAEAGGTRVGAVGELTRLFDLGDRMGIKSGGPDQIMKALRQQLSFFKDPTLRRNQIKNVLGFSDFGTVNRLMMSDEEFNKNLTSAGSAAALGPEAAQKAIDFQRSQEHLAGAQDHLFSTISDSLLPAINALVDKISAVLNGTAGSAGGSLAAAGGLVAGKAVEAVVGWKLLKALGRAFLGGGAAETTATIAAGTGALAATGVAGAALGGGVAAGYGLASLFDKQIEGLMVKWMTRNDYKPLASSFKNRGDLGFWMGQGYNRQQAMGIIANMMHESGGDPNAIGDSGKARGLFQWHPDRRESILKATGIDVYSAGYQDQLKAAAWEMQNGRKGFDDKYYRSMTNEGAAAAYFSNKFESPRDMNGQALARAKTALGLASSIPAFANGGAGGSVKIDKIEINTQATDATGIAVTIKDAVYSALSFVGANVDDGVSK